MTSPRSTSRLGARGLFFALFAMAACQLDPAQDDAVNALGGEEPGVRTGPEHRPGQPCLTCHTTHGRAPDFAVAGTIYETRSSTVGMPGVIVKMTDASGQTRQLQTNSAGNFYMSAAEWSPAFPMRVELAYTDFNGVTSTAKMDTRIGRNGGCGECHQGSGSTTKQAQTFLRETQTQ